MTIMLHASMFSKDQSTMTYVDVIKWPVGLENGLANFYSKANKDAWSILLDSQWRDICKKLDMDANNEENSDKFFDYFVEKYLTKEQGRWKYVVPFQNVGDYVTTIEKMPLYYKLFYSPLEIGQSLWASWKNYHSFDNLSSEYVDYINKQQHKEASKGLISTVSTAFSTAVDIYSGIKTIAHFVWDYNFMPRSWVSSHNEVAAHHKNGKLADGGLIVHYHLGEQQINPYNQLEEFVPVMGSSQDSSQANEHLD